MNYEGNKERALPTIEIRPGVSFYVDAGQQILIDTKNPHNVIHASEMIGFEDHFELLFDKQTRNVKKDSWLEWDDHRCEYLWLRPLEIYDPVGGWNNISDEFRKKLEKMPSIKICGEPFLWDQQQTWLRQASVPWNIITKSDMQVYGINKGFYFDTERKVVPFPHELEIFFSSSTIADNLHFVHQNEVQRQINQTKKTNLKNNPGKRPGTT